MRERQLHRDAAAERMADEIEAVEPERVREGSEVLSQRRYRVVAIRAARRAASAHVGRDPASFSGKTGERRLPPGTGRPVAMHENKGRTAPGLAIAHIEIARANDRHQVPTTTPPSTLSTAPLMKLASSDARNR